MNVRINPQTGREETLVPEGELQELARQFLIQLADRFDDMQQGRIQLSDDVIDLLRAAHLFFIEEDRLDSFPEHAKLFLNTLSRMGYLARMQETELTHSPPREGLEILAQGISELAKEAESVGMGVANMAYRFTISEDGEDQDAAPASLLDTLGSGWLDEISSSSIGSLLTASPDPQLPTGADLQLLKNFWRYGYFVRLCGEAVPEL